MPRKSGPKPAKLLANAAQDGELGTMRTMLQEEPALALEWQPIMNASFMGQADAVRLLLEGGADPNVKSRSSHHYRPLHRTVEFKKTMPKHEGHHQVVDLLLEAGADPFLQGSPNLISAVALCATGGQSQEFLPALLRNEPAELDIFHAAVLGHKSRVAELLQQDPGLARTYHAGSQIWTDEKGWTPLLYCARSSLGDKDPEKARQLAELSQLLLDHGADPAGCVEQVIPKPNRAMLEMFLQAGARIQDDDTINHAACDGHFEALDLLMEYGLRLDGTRGTDHHGGYTPLGCAVSCRSLQGVRWFLEKGEDPNQIKSSQGENCLHVALNFGASNPMLQLLLDHGAELNGMDAAGRTPLAVAHEKNRKKAIPFLEAAGASI